MKLKKFFFALLLLILIGSSFLARAESYRMKNKNVFTLSFLDSALVYSLNYDRNITDWFGLGGGFSYLGANSDFMTILQAYANFYPIGSNTTSLLVSGSGNWVGTNFDDLGISGNDAYGTIGVGVEYRKNFVFRAKVHMIITGDDFFAPYPGISVGGAF